MTTVWPSDRDSRVPIVNQLLSDLSVLERKYIPATIITTEKSVLHADARAAWDNLYDESPVFGSKVIQYDNIAGRVSGVYRSTPTFKLLYPAPPDPSWVLLGTYYFKQGGTSADYVLSNIPQTYDKLVLVMNLRVNQTGDTNFYHVLQLRPNGATSNFYNMTWYLYKTLTASGFSDIRDSAAQTFATMSWTASDNAPRYNSGGFHAEYIGYSISGMQGPVALNLIWITASDFTGYRLQSVILGSTFNTQNLPLTSLTIYDEEGFLEGSNIQIYGVLPK